MATYDDYDGPYFSTQAIRLYHPEITDRTEILVVDNNPSGPCARPLKALDEHVPGYRYLPYERTQGTAVRDLVFREANADFVLCMDSHVLFRPGALARLLDYLEARPDSLDLWQGPLLGDDLRVHATHFDPVWRAGMYGAWAMDPRGLDPDGPEFDIPMQGLGVFGCRQGAWPGFNPRLRGFGGEEGYLHEKVRRAGGRTLCLPFLGWAHRFNRPFGPRYPVSVEDRVRNYLLAHDELGLDPAPAIDHLAQEFGAERVRPAVERAEHELRGPFHFFDAIYCINLDRETGRWEAVMRQCKALGIDHRIRRFAAIDTPSRHSIGRALSHRAVVAEAKWLGLQNVLVLEDDVVFSRQIADVLAQSLNELAGRQWRLLYLGGHRSGPASPTAQGCRCLQLAHGLTGQPAVAYHQSVYEPILAEVPATPTAMARWLETYRGIDWYYAQHWDGMSLVTWPSVASQPPVHPQETPLFEPLLVAE
jgi:Glycosyl transferase family 2/Glycosyltransferase family 25 (LPS biosynthesis protein)